MPGFLRQATAAQSRTLGPFISDTDFKTTSTGLTIANTDIKLVVNGGASANKNSGGGTHRANGEYGVTFDATDTATVGEMAVSVNVSGALVVFDKFFVVEETVYDALFAASAAGYLQSTVAGRLLDVSAGGEAGIDWANVGSPTTAVDLSGTTIKTTQKVDLDTIKTQAVTCAAGVTVLASVGTAATSTAQTGDGYARLGAPAGASVSADIAAVKSDSGSVKTQTDKLTFTVANQIDANVLDWKSATAPAMTGDAYARLGAPAGASVSADIAAAKVDTAAVKLQTDKLAFTVTNQVDANVLDWKSATAPAMTGDAYARLGAPAGASVSADVAAVKADTAAILVDTGTTLDSNITAIKTKTDSLAFTVAGQVDANVQYVNDVQIVGDGDGTPWGPV